MRRVAKIIKCFYQNNNPNRTLVITIPHEIIDELKIKHHDLFQVSLDGASIIYEKVN